MRLFALVRSGEEGRIFLNLGKAESEGNRMIDCEALILNTDVSTLAVGRCRALKCDQADIAKDRCH